MLDEEGDDISNFLFINPFDESDLSQICRFTIVLFGVNSSIFLLEAKIKRHIKKYRKRYPETVYFLNEIIYVDDVIGRQCSVEQTLSTTLEYTIIFKEARKQLHKCHTNSKHLQHLSENNLVILMVILKLLQLKMSLKKFCYSME